MSGWRNTCIVLRIEFAIISYIFGGSMVEKNVSGQETSNAGQPIEGELGRALTPESFEQLRKDVLQMVIEGKITSAEGGQILSDADKQLHWSGDKLDD